MLARVIEEVRGGGFGMASKEGSWRSSTEEALLAEDILLKLDEAEAMVESEKRDERWYIIASARGGRRVGGSACVGRLSDVV